MNKERLLQIERRNHTGDQRSTDTWKINMGL